MSHIRIVNIYLLLIVAYLDDHSRVHLNVEEQGESEFINASHIDVSVSPIYVEVEWLRQAEVNNTSVKKYLNINHAIKNMGTIVQLIICFDTISPKCQLLEEKLKFKLA